MNYKSPKIRKKSPEKNPWIRKSPKMNNPQKKLWPPSSTSSFHRQCCPTPVILHRQWHCHLHLLLVRRHLKPQWRRPLPLRQNSPTPKSAGKIDLGPQNPNRRSHGTPTGLPLNDPQNHRTHGPQLVGSEFWVSRRRRGGLSTDVRMENEESLSNGKLTGMFLFWFFFFNWEMRCFIFSLEFLLRNLDCKLDILQFIID